MRRVCFALAAAAAFTAGQAVAAEPPELPLSNPNAVWDSISVENIAEILREVGAQQVEVHQDGANKVVTFVDGNLPYNLAPAVCQVRPGKCVGMILLVGLDMGTTKIPLESINKQNSSNLFVSFSKPEDSKIVIGRALLVDGGATKKNVAMNIVVFAAVVPEAIKGLSAQVIASAGPQFKQTAYGARQPLRPVFLTPSEVARYSETFTKPFATGLRRGR